MGVSYSATTVVGVALKMRQLFPEKSETRDGCKHPRGDWKFCPECGAKPTVTEVTDDESALPDFPDRDDLNGSEWVGQNSGENWMLHREGSYDGQGDTVYIGVVGHARGYSAEQFDPTPNIDSIRESLRFDLEPLGLWEGFGLYTLCESS